MKCGGVAAAMFCLAVVCSQPSRAQDVRGLEVCTAEKDMVRRTSCLQANVEFLSQSLNTVKRDAADKLAAAGREVAAAKADIATLKDALTKVQVELAEMKKAAAAKPAAAPAKK